MDGQPSVDLDGSRHRLAAIAGTSTCHIVQSPEPVFAPTWGPYKHAVFPGCEYYKVRTLPAGAESLSCGGEV